MYWGHVYGLDNITTHVYMAMRQNTGIGMIMTYEVWEMVLLGRCWYIFSLIHRVEYIM